MVDDPKHKNESIEQLWQQIEVLWRNTRSRLADDVKYQDEVSAIDSLIAKRRKWMSEAEDWAKVNETELRIGSLLSPGQLFTQVRELLAIAKDRALPSLDFHKANAETYFKEPPKEPMNEGEIQIRRDLYLFLLSELQSNFIDRRAERRLRRYAAKNLLIGGGAVFFLSIMSFLYCYWWMVQKDNAADTIAFMAQHPTFGLYLAMAFGIAGAFFSRLTNFNARSSTLSFDDFQSNFITVMLVLRMLTGLLGALVFYYLLRSELIKGDAFPDLSKLAIEKISMVPKESGDGSVTGVFSSFSIVAPGKELAKLIVWSFLAGFSERLVPDSLARAEGGTSRGN